MARWVGLLLALLALWPGGADAQVLVAPRRPGKSVVRYWKHEWRTIDILAGQTIEGAPAGGIRLYYDAREEMAAKEAVAVLEDAYRDLCVQFRFTPPERVPYILYGSYQEFQRTNLFPVQEGVLGITSTETLATTLPWFGDAKRFKEVAKHEMGHAFTLQKVRTPDARGDPSQLLPLWFDEGLAQYVAKGPPEPEDRMVLADLAANPDVEAGYGLVDFWYDIPGSVLWTYTVGQARIAFLEETYGPGVAMKILEAAPKLMVSRFAPSAHSFQDLVEEATGDEPEVIARRFQDWVKHGALASWLDAEQHAGDLDQLASVRGLAQALAASPDGRLLLYRSIDPHSGEVRLVLADAKAPRSTKIVAADGRPGAESLHPIDPRSFDLRDDALVYAAEARGRDVLHWRKVKWRSHDRPVSDEERWDAKVTRFQLGEDHAFAVDRWGLVAAYSPTFSPDGKQVVFVGLAPGGARDLWVLTLADGKAERLTDDVWAEATPSWGPDGIVYTSDATGHGKRNLFRVRPGGAPERLTAEARDEFDPISLPDGRLVFVAWADGRGDLWERTDDGVRAISSIDTALTEPAPGPEGDLWALHRDSGVDALVRVPGSGLVGAPVHLPEPDGPATPPATGDLSAAVPYSAAHLSSWHVEDLFGVVGAGGGYVFGQVFASASDQLRDHLVVLDASTWGDPRLTDGQLLYVNQSGRTTWGAGAFHTLRFHVADDGGVFQQGERFYGGLVSWRYPFDRFLHFQVDEMLGGTKDFTLSSTAAYYGTLGFFGDWKESTGPAELQSETTASLGVDTIVYNPVTGPVAGGSALLAATFGARPTPAAYGMLRLDAERYIPLPLGEGANLGFRGAAGSAFGGDLAPSFWLISHETLRAVPYGDTDFLLGRHYVFGRAELQVPLDAIVRVVFLSGVEAIAGVDAGAADDEIADLWGKRVLDVAVGGNFALGPLVLRVHFARALDIGAPLPPHDPPWRTNVSLGWITW